MTYTRKSKYDPGNVFRSNEGCEYVILERTKNLVKIKFLDDYGYERLVFTENVHRGEVRNYGLPSLFGVGYIGYGDYPLNYKGKDTPVYTAWYNMIKRCYGGYKGDETYQGVTVEKYLQGFQNYADFYYNDKYREEGWHLDKDLLVPGNKVYSRETCIFLPRQINTLISKPAAKKNGLPNGVAKRRKGYMAYIVIEGSKQITLGRFENPDEAFEVYKEAKENHFKSVADFWKNNIDPRAYEALYKLEIPKYSLQ